jgi:hypothetical protein
VEDDISSAYWLSILFIANEPLGQNMNGMKNTVERSHKDNMTNGPNNRNIYRFITTIIRPYFPDTKHKIDFNISISVTSV